MKGRTYGRRRIPDSDIFYNGQLDSGKTRFITETIEMGQFAEAKNKLLIVCEEGEEEYDEKMLKDNGVSMVVLEKEDLTEEKLKELDKQYDPWIVIVEYNGMWDPALLMGLQSRLAGRFTSPLHW